ncbi:MAG TPA: hypothetical protein VJL84_04310 [Kiloniellales bacterium]|nr:hypothetical protein [Kiloniellales bacterium]
MIRRILLIGLLLLPSLTAQALDERQRYEAAKALFDELVYLEQRYDMGLIDLYADDARIVVIELRGDKRYKTEMTGKQLKGFYASYLPTAAHVGEWYVYSNVIISPEGDTAMRVLATRTGQKSGEPFPYQLLVQPGPGGRWLIYEEQTIVRPN